MAQTVSTDEVRRIARLARLELAESELGAFTEQFNQILEYVGRLNEVDTQAVPPMAHVLPLATPWREDQVTPSLPREAALANAPEPDESAFRVPRIIE